MVWLALFRAINVGGRNVVRMADLRSDLETLGLDRVETYLQSGNAIFESNLDEAALREVIDGVLSKRGLVGSGVVLRSLPQLRTVIASSPFHEHSAPDKHKFVSFFDRFVEPTEFKGATILGWSGHEAYWTPSGDGPPPALTTIERRLGFRTTSRNWTVSQALLALLEGRGDP